MSQQDVRNGERWVAYQTCKQRGHQAVSSITQDGPPAFLCKWCGTYYWTTTVEHERNAPQEPEAL